MGRREDILNAAIDLFAEKGFHATPTSEVARKAGVAEGTVFHHFKNKEEILVRILDEMMELYLDRVRALVENGSPGIEKLEELVRFHFDFSQERSRELSVVIRDFPSSSMELGSPFRELVIQRVSTLMDLMGECIQRGKRDGTIRQDVPTEDLAFILRGMLDGLSRMQLLGPLVIPDLTAQVIDFCRQGLARRD